MSIYFLHFLSAFLPLALFLFFFMRRENLILTFFALIVGVTFGFFAHYIAFGIKGGVKNLQLFADISLFFIFLLAWIFPLKFAFLRVLNLVIAAFLAFCFEIEYLVISNGFEIFTQKLLDTLSVANFAFVFFALIICVSVFFLLKFKANLIENRLYFGICAAVFVILNLIKFSGQILLAFLRKDWVKDESGQILSFVAKSGHYAQFYLYIYLAFLLFTAIILLLKRPKNLQKKHILDIEFRKFAAKNQAIWQSFLAAIFICVSSVAILLYYDLKASRPMMIDEPIVVEPDANGEFVFDTAMLSDNKLHRYVYVTDEGKAIRFFMISKYEDRLVPVAVFDSCMICGDKGYIKRGSELICISCNVRVFLPSVGKPGGCNPIPIEYEVVGDKLKITLESVMLGTNYFTEFRPKTVIDPVSKAELINLEAKFSYIYGDKTYFFESEANKKAFAEDPSKFGAELKNVRFRTQGYDNAE